MCWTRETCVIPGALAGILLGMRVHGAKIVVSITFPAILVTILLQATTTRWLGGKLGLLEESKILNAITAISAPPTVARSPEMPCLGGKKTLIYVSP